MTHEILKPGFERNDDRGIFREILNSGHWEAMNWALMNEGSVLGNHYHKKTIVFLYVVSGCARIRTVNINTEERDEFVVMEGQGVMLKTLESHAIHFVEQSQVIMLKSSRFDPNDPDTFHHTV